MESKGRPRTDHAQSRHCTSLDAVPPIDRNNNALSPFLRSSSALCSSSFSLNATSSSNMTVDIVKPKVLIIGAGPA